MLAFSPAQLVALPPVMWRGTHAASSMSRRPLKVVPSWAPSVVEGALSRQDRGLRLAGWEEWREVSPKMKEVLAVVAAARRFPEGARLKLLPSRHGGSDPLRSLPPRPLLAPPPEAGRRSVPSASCKQDCKEDVLQYV